MDSKDSDDGLFASRPPTKRLPFLQRGPSSNSMDSDIMRHFESTASTSSNCTRRCRYDVFISFRGPDTRNSFVDHLYSRLTRKGIFAFKDDQRLQKGEHISTQLVEAIQNSRISIIVFSRDYAASSWCLDEMATIADCHLQFKQTVFPVFYHVVPSHVRYQNGVYEKAFDLHDEKFPEERVDRWKIAMKNMADLAGWDIKDDTPEATVMEKFVQGIIKELSYKIPSFIEGLLGIQPCVEELEKHLRLSSKDDIRVLGIWGMGGIGKTTLATVLYSRISYQFDACCFIDNVSQIYKDGGAIAVQKQILRQSLDEKYLEAYNSSEIFGTVSHRLCNIKVLLVLDNVDQSEQLEKLAINPNSLLAGSIVIIITRDKHILENYEVHEVYEVPLLNENDARELFCGKAFRSTGGTGQSSTCAELIPEVLKCAQGLPLAIKVLGSFLHTRDATQWRDTLARLRNNPEKEIMDVLQVSVDGLRQEEKEIFLHIACFFKGERQDYVKRILDACQLHHDIGIQVLIDKSLISIRNEEIHMHDMLQELGKQNVRQQFPRKPASWSRLWLYEDFHQVLWPETVNRNIEAIVLDQKEDIYECRAEGLSTMTNLRLLILYQKNFSGRLDFLSNQLQYLSWHGYPFASLPLTFGAHYLVELNMPDSGVKLLWEGNKHLPNLKRVDLSDSKFLIETPDFERIPNLERLDLTGCTSLVRVHPSIGLLAMLKFLSLRNCSNLVTIDFAHSVSKLSSLEVLHLSGCSKLVETPDFTGAINLKYLDMDGCRSLPLVHESIGSLAKLTFLSMRDCINLVSIPSNINSMTSLITLDFYGCSKLMNLPLEKVESTIILESSHGMKQSYSYCTLKSLVSLDLSFCNLHDVSHAMEELHCLERLNLQGNKFTSILSSNAHLYSLAYLNLAHCHEIQSFPYLPAAWDSSVGRYFETTSGSRDHRSGLYVFDCPKMMDFGLASSSALEWLKRLVKRSNDFRCGFDILVPCIDSLRSELLSLCKHKFNGDSIIRIRYDEHDNYVGFIFAVTFEANNNLDASSTSPHHSFSSPLPHPFYLSFESEYTEERFDMPLKLELDKIDGSKHIWIIYISREHCHFVKSGAHVTFKACQGLMVKEWGLCMVTRKKGEVKFPSLDHGCIEKVGKSSNSGLKIQLPYNWLVSEKEEAENLQAKRKETTLFNVGLH